MEPKTEKRIVSKGDYVQAHGKRIGLAISGRLFVKIGRIICVVGPICFLIFISTEFDNGLFSIGALLLSFVLVWIAAHAVQKGEMWVRLAQAIDPGVPLTRGNTADLPAPDSLVRASEEPLQAQEGVLLRAAVESVERHEEQLVRASVGQESVR